jgi:hypothetical protein
VRAYTLWRQGALHAARLAYAYQAELGAAVAQHNLAMVLDQRTRGGSWARGTAIRLTDRRGAQWQWSVHVTMWPRQHHCRLPLLGPGTRLPYKVRPNS